MRSWESVPEPGGTPTIGVARSAVCPRAAQWFEPNEDSLRLGVLRTTESLIPVQVPAGIVRPARPKLWQGHPAAVGGDHLAGDEARALGQEEQGQIRHLLGLADARERRRVDHALAHRVGE